MPDILKNFQININKKGEVKINDVLLSPLEGKKFIDLRTKLFTEVLRSKECPVVDPPITPMCLQCKIEITGD